MEDKARISLWRSLFYGRQDVFGKRMAYFDTKLQEQVMRYHPVTDSTGEHVPLSDAWVSQHLNGQAELLIYLMQLDSTAKFGAIDYDESHTFDDTFKSKKILEGAGIKCHIARSTRKGFHLYVFITERIPVHYLVAIYDYLFERAGFQDDIRYDRRLAPETFPRRVRTPSLGHGIKPPLWGAGLPDHNCWVDDNNNPIEDQWAYTQWIYDEGRNEAQTFMKSIEDHPEIEFIRDGIEVSKVEIRANREKPEYKAPEFGDFNKVVQRCDCMKKLWNTEDKMLEHDKRVALLAFAKATSNGFDVIRNRFLANGGNSAEVERQIKYAVDTNQLPWTCQALKTRNFCNKKDWCLETRPPSARIDGRVVINPHNLPKEQWPEPSPIRFAFESQIMDPGVLRVEIARLKDYTGADREELIANLCKNILQLETKKRVALEEELAEHKIFKNRSAMKRHLQALEAEINKEKNKKLPLLHTAGFEIGESPTGYVVYTEGKNGEKIPNLFTNFKVYLTHDIAHVGVFEYRRQLIGTVHVFRDDAEKPQIHKFNVSAKEFYEGKIVPLLGEIAGPSLLVHTGSRDVDTLRACITAFGSQSLVQTVKYEEYGMRVNPDTHRPEKYLAGGDLVITAQGITNDPANSIDLSGHEVARGLGLKDVSTGVLREVLQHFVRDVLTCHEPAVIYTVISHSLQSTIHETMIPLQDKPTLWVQGLTGSGKSFVGEIAAAMHGDARSIILNARTTTKAMESYAAVFKDALLVIDDYKAGFTEAGMKGFIQNVYDSKARGRLKQNGKQNNAPRVRALCMVTAEDLVTNEASAIARLIVVRTGSISHDSEEARRREKEIKRYINKYPAITANFIKFMLNQTVESVQAHYEPIREILMKEVKNSQNSNRLCNNLAANYLTFAYFLDFLVSYNIITEEQRESYRCTHGRTVHGIIKQMNALCTSEQASNVFLNTLSEILATGEFYIEGATQGMNSARCLGYVKKDSVTHKLTHVYLLPGVCVEAVKKHKNNFGEGLSHTADSIGQQLKQMDVLLETYDNRTTVRRTFNGKYSWVWSCDPEKLGFNAEANDNEPPAPESTEAMLLQAWA